MIKETENIPLVILSTIPDSDIHVVMNDIVVYSDVLDKVINIKRGFVTDLASIPYIATIGIPKRGEHDFSSIIHDYLYSKKNGVDDKSVADKVFKEFLLKSEVGNVRTYIMYMAVRVFGKSGYKQEKRKTKLEEKFPQWLIDEYGAYT